MVWSGSKEPIFFLPTGLQDESYLHCLPSVSSLHHVKTSCPLPLFWLFRKIETNKDTFLKFSDFKYFIPFRVPPNGLYHENQTKTMINLKKYFSNIVIVWFINGMYCFIEKWDFKHLLIRFQLKVMGSQYQRTHY